MRNYRNIELLLYTLDLLYLKFLTKISSKNGSTNIKKLHAFLSYGI